MKSRLFVAAVAFLGYAILDATPANAEDYDWVGDTSTAWSNPNNWNPDSGYPGSAVGDTATVGPGVTYEPVLDVDLDGTTSPPYRIVSLHIEEDGVVDVLSFEMCITGSGGLNIDAVDVGAESGKLRSSIGGDVVLMGVGDHYINGEMTLEASGSTLRISSNLTLRTDSSGFISGQNNAAEIKIDDNVTLTSTDVEMRGRMRFVDEDEVSAGSFTNHGKVIANAENGTLDFQIKGTIDDDGLDSVANERWQVTASGAMLRFLEQPAAMEGRFFVSNGMLRAGDDEDPGDAINVVTTGHLKHTGGVIVAGLDDSFVFNY